MCCRNEYKTSGDYIWRFDGDKITPEYLEWCNNIDKCHKVRRSVAILQYTLDGNFIAMYNSLTKAQNATGISRYCIKNVCDGNAESSKGFIWRYASNAEDSSPVLSQIA